jgi:GlcNAc-P-P-Und epimerase
MIAKGFDLISLVTGMRFSVSAILVKKFCANSLYNTTIDRTEFVAPVPLLMALELTVRHEFIEKHENEQLFFRSKN